MPVPDNEMIAGIFPGKVISVANGKVVRHGRAWCYREGVRNCARDEGRSLGVGLQEQAPNQLKLRWLRARVVSLKAKSRQKIAMVKFPVPIYFSNWL